MCNKDMIHACMIVHKQTKRNKPSIPPLPFKQVPPTVEYPLIIQELPIRAGGGA